MTQVRTQCSHALTGAFGNAEYPGGAIMDMKKELEFAQGIAKEAGKIITQNFQIGMEKEWKEDNSPLTTADTKINELVVSEVRKAYPHHGIISEEGSVHTGEEMMWICDPIDGTIPFAHGIPTCVFMLALTKEGKSLLGVIYDPFMNRLFHAVKGGGSFMNGKKITVSDTKTLENAAIGISYWKDANYQFPRTREVLMNAGSFTLDMGGTPPVGYADVLVASGEFAGVIFPGEEVWDTAAPKIIVEEAGGKMTDVFGNEPDFRKQMKGHVASNGHLHQELLSIIRKEIGSI